MNLGQIKQKAIKLINEYSNNGALVPIQKNKDYYLRMNDFINDAQFEIATMARKIKSSATYNLVKNYEDFTFLTLPEDIFEVKNMLLNNYLFFDYLIDDKQLKVPGSYEGNLKVNYYKYPAVINDSTPDAQELEVDIDAQNVIPYFTAGMIIMDENSGVSGQLLSIYNTKLQNLVKSEYNGVYTIPNITGW